MKLSKVVSFLLCVIILLNLSLPIANAAEVSSSEIGEIVVNGTQAVYYFENSVYRYAAAVNTETATGCFSILYFNDTNYVHEYHFTVDPNNINIHSISFWQSIISDCMDSSSFWNDIYLPSAVIISETKDNSITTFAASSYEDEFVPLLEDYFDSEEYTEAIIATGYHNGTIFHLHEDLEFLVYKKYTITLSQSLSVLSLVTALLGYGYTSLILGGVALAADFILPSETEVGTHTVGARWFRYVKKKDSDIWLTEATIHSICFDAFVIERMDYYAFDEESKDEFYAPSQADFEDKHGQINEGIAYYLTL